MTTPRMPIAVLSRLALAAVLTMAMAAVGCGNNPPVSDDAVVAPDPAVKPAPANPTPVPTPAPPADPAKSTP